MEKNPEKFYIKWPTVSAETIQTSICYNNAISILLRMDWIFLNYRINMLNQNGLTEISMTSDPILNTVNKKLGYKT